MLDRRLIYADRILDALQKKGIISSAEEIETKGRRGKSADARKARLMAPRRLFLGEQGLTGSTELKSMLSRYLGAICLVGSLAVVAGCDPEALIKKKVPEPLQSALTFSSTRDAKKAPAKAAEPEPQLAIIVPANNAFYPVGRPVRFQARVEPESLKVEDKRLTWQIFQMMPSPDPKKGPTLGPPRPIGSGRNVSAEVGPGSYQVELTLAMGGKGNIVKKGNFRVDVSVSGRVVHNGQGLPETDFTLAEAQTQKTVAGGKSDKEGVFFVELPPTGNYRLTPSKPGFSFNPPYAYVARKPQPVKVDFQGAKARIEGIQLIPDETSDEKIEELCPEQMAFLKAAVASEAPVKDLTVVLIPTAPGSAPVPIGRAAYSEDASVTPTAAGSAPVKVEIPLDAGRGTKLTTYRLRVTAVDDKGNAFSAEAPEPIKLDLARCLDRKFAEAASRQEQGELEQATKFYDRVEEYHKSMGDPSASSGTMEKMFFNEGLAFLRMAMPLGSDDLKRHGHLAKALNDFNEVLKLHKRDAGAFMFKGLALEMRQNPGAALESYNSAIGSDPKLADAYVLRGLAYMESGAKKNLSRAVDDFTEAITLNPAQTDLRALRRALLSLDISLPKEKDDSPVDTSAFAARKAEIIQSRLNQRKHIRK